MNSADTSRPPYRKRAVQFLGTTLLLLLVVTISFVAGRYSAQPVSSKTADSSKHKPSTWDPAYSVPCAIAGPIDMDGDGSDDLVTLKNLISNSGGTVVAYQHPNGSVFGKVDGTTQFCVVENPSDPNLNSNSLVLDANAHSVPLISVEELLSQLGVQSRNTANPFHQQKQEATNAG